jgi:hypothetical protein
MMRTPVSAAISSPSATIFAASLRESDEALQSIASTTFRVICLTGEPGWDCTIAFIWSSRSAHSAYSPIQTWKTALFVHARRRPSVLTLLRDRAVAVLTHSRTRGCAGILQARAPIMPEATAAAISGDGYSSRRRERRSSHRIHVSSGLKSSNSNRNVCTAPDHASSVPASSLPARNARNALAKHVLLSPGLRPILHTPSQ